MRRSNIADQQPTFRHIQAYPILRHQMSGNGILSKLSDYAKKAHEVYTGELATDFRNSLPNADSTGRPGFPGEAHGILALPNGRNGVANFLGPGTEIVGRVKRKDPPRTPADFLAKKHNIRYRSC